LFVLKNGLSCNRIGFTLVRKYGNAPERNRARRLGREAYRHLRPRLKTGYDLVLLVYPEQAGSGQGSLEVRQAQLGSLFGKAGLILDGN
jgi:ribonuclease P protein component